SARSLGAALIFSAVTSVTAVQACNDKGFCVTAPTPLAVTAVTAVTVSRSRRSSSDSKPMAAPQIVRDDHVYTHLPPANSLPFSTLAAGVRLWYRFDLLQYIQRPSEVEALQRLPHPFRSKQIM